MACAYVVEEDDAGVGEGCPTAELSGGSVRGAVCVPLLALGNTSSFLLLFVFGGTTTLLLILCQFGDNLKEGHCVVNELKSDYTIS